MKRVWHSRKLTHLLIWNLDRELLLNGHNDLYGVKRVEAKIVREGRVGRDLTTASSTTESAHSALDMLALLASSRASSSRLSPRRQCDATHLCSIDLLERLQHVRDARLDICLRETRSRCKAHLLPLPQSGRCRSDDGLACSYGREAASGREGAASDGGDNGAHDEYTKGVCKGCKLQEPDRPALENSIESQCSRC